jgi:hypothetical protein
MTQELTVQACETRGYSESTTIRTDQQLHDKGDSPLLSVSGKAVISIWFR